MAKLTEIGELTKYVKDLDEYFDNLWNKDTSGKKPDPPEAPEFDAKLLGKLLNAAYIEELKKKPSYFAPIVREAKIGFALLKPWKSAPEKLD